MRLSERKARMFDPLPTRESAPTQRYGNLRRGQAGGASGSLLPGVAMRTAHHRRERNLLQFVHNAVVNVFAELRNRNLDQEHNHDARLPAAQHGQALREPQMQPTGQ